MSPTVSRYEFTGALFIEIPYFLPSSVRNERHCDQ